MEKKFSMRPESIEFLKWMADAAEESAQTYRREREKEEPGVKKIRQEMDRVIKDLLERAEKNSR